MGYMYELDKELRAKLSDYPFCEIILDETMNYAFDMIKECTWDEGSLNNKEVCEGSIILSMRKVFGAGEKSFKSKYWDLDNKYIGKKEYNKENLDYETFVSYLDCNNKTKVLYFMGGAEYLIRHYKGKSTIESNKNIKAIDIYELIKIALVLIALFIAYLWVLNDRYYVLNTNGVIDKWNEVFIPFKELIK